jgi:hypothetical protein
MGGPNRGAGGPQDGPPAPLTLTTLPRWCMAGPWGPTPRWAGGPPGAPGAPIAARTGDLGGAVMLGRWWWAAVCTPGWPCPPKACWCSRWLGLKGAAKPACREPAALAALEVPAPGQGCWWGREREEAAEGAAPPAPPPTPPAPPGPPPRDGDSRLGPRVSPRVSTLERREVEGWDPAADPGRPSEGVIPGPPPGPPCRLCRRLAGAPGSSRGRLPLREEALSRDQLRWGRRWCRLERRPRSRSRSRSRSLPLPLPTLPSLPEPLPLPLLLLLLCRRPRRRDLLCL